jgi:hypothetical protein
MATQEDSGISVPVKRGKFDSLSLYDVTESELTELGRGGSDSILLNFAIFLLSTAISFLVALLTTEIKSVKTFCVFVIVTIFGFVGGLILLILWGKSRRSVSGIVKTIRARMPNENPIDKDAEQTDAVSRE